MNTFKHASAVYKEKHGKPPVIIYDNISQLDPEILDYLQSDAYDNAYDNVIDTREALKNYKRVTNNTFAQLYYRELRSLHDTLTDDANISRYWSQIKDLLQG